MNPPYKDDLLLFVAAINNRSAASGTPTLEWEPNDMVRHAGWVCLTLRLRIFDGFVLAQLGCRRFGTALYPDVLNALWRKKDATKCDVYVFNYKSALLTTKHIFVRCYILLFGQSNRIYQIVKHNSSYHNDGILQMVHCPRYIRKKSFIWNSSFEYVPN